MKKILSMLLATLMMAALLAGCGGGGGTSASGGAAGGGDAGGGTPAGGGGGGYDLVFWVYSDVVQNEQGRLMNEWVAEFVAENDNCNSITLVPKNDSELLTSLMAGVGLPDCFFASARNGKQFRDAIGLIDLKEMYDSDPEYTAGFYPNAIDAVTVDGGMWAVPFISYIPIIYRNLTILEAAGIDPDEGIPTYDAFVEQLAKVKAAGYDATHSWSAGGYYCTGAIMGSDAPNITVGVENGETTVKPEQIVRTFETMLRIEEYANAMTYGQDVTQEAFKTDKLAFILDGPWSEPGIEQSGVKYDVVLVPAYEEGGWTGGLQGWDFMYGVASDDAEKDALVTAWLKKLGEFESEKAWTKYVGRSTLRQDVMDDPEVLETMMAQVTSEGLKKGMQQMEFVHTSVFWASPIGDISPQVASGTYTPEQGAEEFIKAVNAMYKESGEF